MPLTVNTYDTANTANTADTAKQLKTSTHTNPQQYGKDIICILS